MNREQAKRLIIETFESAFDKKKFTYFLRNLVKSYEEETFEYSGNYIPDAFKPYINSLERIGKYTYDGTEIDLLIVQLKKEISLERARTTQRNFIAWYLKGSRGGKLKDAALVAFVSPNSEDWRFSLVKMDYRFEEKLTAKGKVRKAIEEFTPARRFSFLVGKNEKSHTAQSRFLPILENDNWKPNLEDLEEAFNVEVVTKEFFQKYRDLFIITKLELDEIVQKDSKVRKEFRDKNINTVDFAKKLLGQIVFLYFLQKKGWLGVQRGQHWGTGPKDFLRRLFNGGYGKYRNFYNDMLEPLFYEALRTDRSSAGHYYSRFNCKIPFLNGGLFDPINNFDWVNVDILLPNELFSNTRKTKEGDIGDGILDVFDRYNFTVNEEEPLEKEVALDPELLGKIYEKLNAIRPDNFDEYVQTLKSGRKDEEVKFNKENGVYYTPREIVHYMCQESLKNYLEEELKGKVPKEDIEKFVEIADSVLEREIVALEREQRIKEGIQKTTIYESEIPETIKENAKEIDKLLADIKVCDPAVGSGAFPVGMMHEIVKLRQLLSIYLGKQIKVYDLKRHCIENSLYGVDKDSGAVEVCKLRFWLSLIVDEEDFYNIKPLPNLDYKVVCGDSLLELEKDLFNQKAFSQLEKLKQQYFNETNPNRKQKLKDSIDSLIYQITKGYREFDFRVYFSEVFHQKRGFDVVIANPPYIKEYINRKAFDKIRTHPYYQGKMDIWYFFASKSIDLLKNGGILSFIAQNNWVTSFGASKMRNKVIKDTKIIQLVDFGPYFVFENSDIQTMIMIFKKDSKTDNYTFDYRRLKNNTQNFKDVLDILYKAKNSNIEYLTPTISRKKYLDKELTFSETNIENILKKIQRKGTMNLVENEITQGIVCPQDFLNRKNAQKLNNRFPVGTGIFVLSDAEKNSLKLTKKELEIIKPYYTTSELHRYYGDKKNKYWIIYTKPDINTKIKDYPNIKRHLDQFKSIITSDFGPYGLHRARNENFFNGAKIVSLRKCKRPTFTYTDFDCYVSQTFFVIKTSRWNMKFLTGLLNSKVVSFWLWHKGKRQGDLYQVDKEPLKSIPIPPINSQNQHIAKKIESLVSQILSITQSGNYLSSPQKQEKVKELENEIDQLVYRLYDLTPEEIKIIEREIEK